MPIMRADHRGHELLLPETRRMAEANIEFFRRHRRLLRFVDTRQKWMLLHLVAVTSAGDRGIPPRGAAANWICERAVDLGISSRNTALAYFNQLVVYGFLRKEECSADRRIRLISLSDAAEAMLADWTATLLAVATDEDASWLCADTLRRIYLETATTLLNNPKWLKAPVDIKLTQDMRGGWLVMSEILRRLPTEASAGDWLPALDLNIPSMTTAYGLSRSTLYRLVRLSVEAGIMTWEDRQGVATLTVSFYHLRQYGRWTDQLLQAVKTAHDVVPAGRTSGSDELSLPRLDLVPIAGPEGVRTAA